MDTISILTCSFSIVILLAFLLSGFFMGRKVKNASEFDKGGKSAGTLLVAGNIIGTLAGGSSTVGTAQLSFNFGLSALWFTLGAAIGCVVLAVFLVTPLRKSDSRTIVGMISREYGEKTGTVAGVLSAFGIMINLVAQVLAANALLLALFPINPSWCAVISAAMMFLYVFGGVKGTGYLGIVKTILLYFTIIVSVCLCLILSGGFSVFAEKLPHAQYFNLMARGAGIDLGAGLSVVLGVISTQTYVQTILSAKDDKSAKRGTLISAVIMVLIGLGSVLIGYFMKITVPDLTPSQAFPQFIKTYVPPFISQLMLIALLITVVGTGAGLSLGLSATISNDIVKKILKDNVQKYNMLTISRLIIAAALTFAVIITYSSLKSTILTWGFMSMGLRAVVLMVPMLCALFLPKKTNQIAAILSSAIGLAAMMIVFITPISKQIDPLIVGMTVVFVIYLVNILWNKFFKNRRENNA